MSAFGIICETNPMHNGHKYLIEQAVALGADRIVCIMSGNTVQRGEFAVADKYIRAEALIKCGADLVIELPFPWCSGSAEHFSRGGVKIAGALCDTLLFGSECGDIEKIKQAATEAAKEDFRATYNKGLEDGAQAATLYYNMIYERTGVKLSSNDLLGVEYIRAAINLGLELDFKTVQRRGDGYMSEDIVDLQYPSAMAIRGMWTSGCFENTETFIPHKAYEVYSRAKADGKITSFEAFDAFWLSYFRLGNEADFANIAGNEGGLVNRICSMSKVSRGADELLEKVKTKRFTDSHIRRVCLYCLAGVTNDDLKDLPTEALVLGANDKGKALLSKNRKKKSFRLVTKPADLNHELRQNLFGQRIDSIFSLGQNGTADAETYLKKKPYIEN